MRIGMSMTAAVIAGMVCNARAQLHEGDIIISVHNGRLVTGDVDPITGEQGPGDRVFNATLGGVVPNFTNDPGYDHVPGPFGASSMIGFNIRKALRKWDGVDFSTIPEERLEFRKGALSPIPTPLDDTLTPGFMLTVGSNLRWHEHFGMLLLTPSSDGVYLVELELLTTEPGVEMSEPYWIVIDQNAPAQVVLDATNWVVDNFDSPGGPIACNPADLNTASASSPSAPGFGEPDGILTPSDFFAFVYFFQTGDLRADLNNASATNPSASGFGQPDGLISPADFIAFAFYFQEACN